MFEYKNGKSTKERGRSLKSAGGKTVPKHEKVLSIAHAKKYSENGRVVDEDNHEDKVNQAMKARRLRRNEILGRDVHAPNRPSKTSLKIPRFEKSPDSYKLILNALQNNVLFNDCSQEQLDHIIMAMKPKKVPVNFKLINEGDEGYNFYVVQKGKFDYIKNKEKIGAANGGDCFGELALLYYAPRAATVVSAVPSEVWKLDRQTFRRILDSSNQVKQERIRAAFQKSPLFEDFSEERIEQLVDTAHYLCFRQGDVIIKKGDKGTIFYVIAAGSVQVTKAGEDLNDTIFGPGDYFGERSLITNEARNANIIAIEDTDLVALDKQMFNKYLGSYLKLLDQNLGLRVLKSVDLLTDLEPEQFERLCDELITEHVKAGKKVIRQGDEGNKFFIIKSGKVDIVKEEDGEETIFKTLETGSYFGEMALLDKEPRSASAIAKTDCVFFTLDRENFQALFGPLEGLTKAKKLRKDELRKISTKFGPGSEKADDDKIKFEDLKILSVLGTGTFGRVKLVQHLKTKETYALKILQKQQIVEFRQQDNVMNEKQILMQSNHPFILKLYATYKDKDRLYMLLELVQGGELFTLLHTYEENKLTNAHSKFYAACVIDALHYLHDLKIVYRDLKPENLMIDTDGYIKVVDFGFAKKVTQKSYTLCGTPEYLAPELVLQKGHNRAVDYWAVGVLIFEMINGSSPFADLRRQEQITICRNIVRMRYEFPKNFPAQPKDLVKKLLKRYPHDRLGMTSIGAQEIKNHEWFDDVDWKVLKGRKVDTPWKPEIEDNLDTSNFDEYEEEEQDLEYTGEDDDWAKLF